jgi:DNA polymerase-4
MNSYFASVEQQANPHLRNRPVGVCEHLGGIIIAPSVEAKRIGIKLGTTVWDARKIYPQIVLLPVDPEKYRHVTKSFLRVLTDYTDRVERYSIDEAFVDLSRICRDFDEALLIGLEIKQRLRSEVGEWVSCSVGIGPNKLVAKIAADLGEGDIDRICVVKPEDIPKLYNRLALTDIPGIAHRLEAALNQLGIFTLRQLADYPLGNLLNQFGISGFFLHQMANFVDTAEMVTRDLEEIKSFGHSYTVSKAMSDPGDIRKLILKLCEKVGRRMRAKGAQGNIVHYFHSDKRYFGFHKQRKIGEFINDGAAIYRAVFAICRSQLPLRFPLKIIGVTVSGLRFQNFPEPLFQQYQKPIWFTQVADKINDKYGEFTIRRARLLEIPAEWAKDTVGFGRMKELSS